MKPEVAHFVMRSSAMTPLEEITKSECETLRRLASALKYCTDTTIREVIRVRLEELRRKLAQLSNQG